MLPYIGCAQACTSKLSPDGDGSITDPGSTAAVTPASTKGKARATLIGSETESNSEGEATLGSPTKRKSKPASSVLRPGCALLNRRLHPAHPGADPSHALYSLARKTRRG
jgi:hypothetical protein